jgi:hypothetical protein
MKLRPGDKVLVTKPRSWQGTPNWSLRMDTLFDGKIITVTKVYHYIGLETCFDVHQDLSDGSQYWIINTKWCKKLDSEPKTDCSCSWLHCRKKQTVT